MLTVPSTFSLILAAVERLFPRTSRSTYELIESLGLIIDGKIHSLLKEIRKSQSMELKNAAAWVYVYTLRFCGESENEDGQILVGEYLNHLFQKGEVLLMKGFVLFAQKEDQIRNICRMTRQFIPPNDVGSFLNEIQRSFNSMSVPLDLNLVLTELYNEEFAIVE